MKDEKKRKEDHHRKLVTRMISGAEGGAGFLAQDHEANSVERRFAGVLSIGRRCQPLEEMRRTEERVGVALAVRRKRAEHGGQAVQE